MPKTELKDFYLSGIILLVIPLFIDAIHAGCNIYSMIFRRLMMIMIW